MLEQITANQFGIFVLPARSRYANILASEIAWLKNEDDTIFGVVLQERQNRSYAGMLLARYKNLEVRFYKQNLDFQTEQEAVIWLDGQARQLSRKPGFQKAQERYLRNRRDNLFAEFCGEEPLNPAFAALRDSRQYAPAKELVSKLMPAYRDMDDNCKRRFQTDGFEPGLWELFLHGYFSEEGMRRVWGYDTPSFRFSKGREEIALRAVTWEHVFRSGVWREEKHEIPFVLAVDGVPGEAFRWGMLSAQQISAVLCLADETIEKLNRIGLLCGYGGSEAADASCEMWAEGVKVFHNPQALVPLAPAFFDFAAQEWPDGLCP